jgi:hypothetical protein
MFVNVIDKISERRAIFHTFSKVQAAHTGKTVTVTSYAKFGVLTEVLPRIKAVGDVTLSQCVVRDFKKKLFFNLQNSGSPKRNFICLILEDKGTIFLRNIVHHSPTSHSRHISPK